MSNIVATKAGIKGLCTHKLNDDEFINELQNTYNALLISNYGPRSSLTLVRNAAESDFLTSSSSTLIQQLPFSHPCFKFINALITAQSKAQGAHGLFVGALCSELLFRSLKLEDSISHRVISDTTDYIQQILNDYLLNKKNKFSFKIDIGSLDHLLCVVRGVIKSKTWRILTMGETEFIAVKTIEAFLQSVPQGDQMDFGNVLISTFEGQTPLSSRVINGILYRDPDYTIDELRSRLKRYSTTLKVVIFNVPLSQDVDEKKIIQWDLRSTCTFSSYLFDFLRKPLKAKNVQIIANQKFIDPVLKYDLEKEGFLVLERLGTCNAKFLSEMAGCCPISEIIQLEAILDSQVGRVSAVEALTLGEKAYIHIQPLEFHRNVSFALTGSSCYSLDYLKESIESSITLLQRMVADSSVVCGAGCFEAHLAYVLAELRQQEVSQFAQTLDTTSVKVSAVFDMYIETFLRLAIIPSGGKSAKLLDYFVDSEYHHLWATSNNFESNQEPDTSNNLESNPDLDTFNNLELNQEPETSNNFASNPEPDTSNNLESNQEPDTSNNLESNQELDTSNNLEPNQQPEVLSEQEHLSQIKHFTQNIEFRCACKCICKEKLSKDTQFIPLLSLKRSDVNLKARIYEASVSSFLEFRENCIVDSLSAKLNALQFAFDGFSELLRIGICVYDK